MLLFAILVSSLLKTVEESSSSSDSIANMPISPIPSYKITYNWMDGEFEIKRKNFWDEINKTY